MKYLLLLVALLALPGYVEEDNNIQAVLAGLQKQIDNLQWQVDHTDYEQHMEHCFWTRDVCFLKGKEDHKVCEQRHEQCVIDADATYKHTQSGRKENK